MRSSDLTEPIYPGRGALDGVLDAVRIERSRCLTVDRGVSHFRNVTVRDGRDSRWAHRFGGARRSTQLKPHFHCCLNYLQRCIRHEFIKHLTFLVTIL